MAGDYSPLSSVMPNISHSVAGPVGTGFFGQLQAQKEVGPLRPWKAGIGRFLGNERSKDQLRRCSGGFLKVPDNMAKNFGTVQT